MVFDTCQRMRAYGTSWDRTSHKGYFRGGSNIDIILITYKDKIVILSKLQSYVLHWYHAYILHSGMDRTEAMICQHLYWTNIRDAVRKEVNNCDNFKRTKRWLGALDILRRWPDIDPVPSTMGTWQHWFCVTTSVFIPTINKTVIYLSSLIHSM